MFKFIEDFYYGNIEPQRCHQCPALYILLMVQWVDTWTFMTIEYVLLRNTNFTFLLKLFCGFFNKMIVSIYNA